MCRGKNCFWHEIPSIVESEPILALRGDIVAPHQGASLPGNVSFYSRPTLRVVGKTVTISPAHRLSLALDKEPFVRPLAAVLLLCASCFSQAGSSQKPPSLRDGDEVQIGKAILGVG